MQRTAAPPLILRVLLNGYEPQSPASSEVADCGARLFGRCVDRVDHSVGSRAWRCGRIFLAYLQSLFPFIPSLPQLESNISAIVARVVRPTGFQHRGDCWPKDRPIFGALCWACSCMRDRRNGSVLVGPGLDRGLRRLLDWMLGRAGLGCWVFRLHDAHGKSRTTRCSGLAMKSVLMESPRSRAADRRRSTRLVPQRRKPAPLFRYRAASTLIAIEIEMVSGLRRAARGRVASPL